MGGIPMIFYFSGTGNSLQAARALCGPGEEPLDLALCLREGRTSFALGEGEELGFVCPVYYAGLPSVVLDFVERLELQGAPAWCYGVLTCASSPAGAAGMLEQALAARGVRLDAAYTVVMPENDSIHYTISPEEERDRILAEAETALGLVRECVKGRVKLGLSIPPRGRLLTEQAYPYYEKDRETARFWIDEQCVGCGVCVRRCPARAMEMEGDRPRWVKDKCILCMACLRCGAVQYGETTVGKKRYVNPILKPCH